MRCCPRQQGRYYRGLRANHQCLCLQDPRAHPYRRLSNCASRCPSSTGRQSPGGTSEPWWSGLRLHPRPHPQGVTQCQIWPWEVCLALEAEPSNPSSVQPLLISPGSTDPTSQLKTQGQYTAAKSTLRAPEGRTVMNGVSGTIRPVSPEVTWSSKTERGRTEKTKTILIFLLQKKKL